MKGTTYIHPIIGRHSLFPTSYTRIAVVPSYDGSTLAGVIRAYHVPHERQTDLGSSFPPRVFVSMSEEIASPEPTLLPFWFKPDSIFGLFSLTTFIGSLLVLTMSVTLALIRLMLAEESSPHGSDANLSVAGYVVEGGSLSPRMRGVLPGYC